MRFSLTLIWLLLTWITPASAISPLQRTILFSGGCPTIGGVCPAISLNFQTGKYWVQGLGFQPLTSLVTTTRASAKTNLRPTSASGFAYTTFAANVLAVDSNGALIEEARTNQLLNSTTPATQTTGSLVNGTYTLWVNGSGSAQMSAGTATGCGTGTATNGTPVSFTTTGAAGTCTVTVTGALNAFQLELGSFGTSLIVTAGSTATRAADVPQLIGPALTAALAAKSAFFQTSGVGGTTGANRLLDFPTPNSYMTFTTSVNVQLNAGGTTRNATIGGSGTYSNIVKSAFGFDFNSVSLLANGGTQTISAIAWPAPSGSVYLGNSNGANRALNGYMQRFALSPSKGVFDGATAP